MSTWSNLLDRIMRPSVDAAYERGWADGSANPGAAMPTCGMCGRRVDGHTTWCWND